MPKTLGRSLWIFALLVFTVWSWQWFESTPTTNDDNDSTLRMAETETDYYLQDFRIVSVDNASGQVYELSGQALSHHGAGGNSSISQPAIKVFGADKTYWEGRAQQGDISPDFRQLALFGAVNLAQFPNLPADLDPALARGVDKPAVEISSASVNIDTTRQTISTDDPVTIRSEHWSLNANKMRADINDSKLLFDAGLDAEYLVPQ
jgi:LPS export ABC transporter protein LptC